mmetsp:Transcript_30833/g.66227  ORF Transcript_30833/g.66227 Transcript_30833/m.66227 type:complete len:333 (+) Transcript_30833:397-1395(+)
MHSGLMQPCSLSAHESSKTMEQWGASASLSAPMMMGEGTSPKAWMTSVVKASAKARVSAGEVSRIVRVMPAVVEKVKRTQRKMKMKKRETRCLCGATRTAKKTKTVAKTCSAASTSTMSEASSSAARHELRALLGRSRWRSRSRSAPPRGVPSMPPSATTMPKLSEASACVSKTPSESRMSGPKAEMPMMDAVCAAYPSASSVKEGDERSVYACAKTPFEHSDAQLQPAARTSSAPSLSTAAKPTSCSRAAAPRGGLVDVVMSSGSAAVSSSGTLLRIWAVSAAAEGRKKVARQKGSVSTASSMKAAPHPAEDPAKSAPYSNPMAVPTGMAV